MLKKTFIGILTVVLMFPLMVVTVNAEQCDSNSLKLRTDFHKHIISPDVGNALRMLGIPLNIMTGEDIINNVPHGSKAIVLSDAYMVSRLADYGLISDEYETVKRSNNYVSVQCAVYSNKLIPYGSINPLKDYAFEEIERCREELNLKGLKMHFANSGVDLKNPEHFNKIRKIFAYASKNKIPLLVHQRNVEEPYGSADAKKLVGLLAQYPELKIQLAHLGGWGGFDHASYEYLQTLVQELKAHPEIKNVYLDLSGVVLTDQANPALAEGVPTPTAGDYQKAAALIRDFGLDKIVFGSDTPLYNSTDDYIEAFSENFPLTKKEMKKIFEQTPDKTLFKGLKFSIGPVEHSRRHCQ
ncbi:amidohydrolase family protein [Pelotomaculum terephthalicicum JT]|uniref:amidohydrolase family protein n=1 Tax=Pelotomaculum TaxID=191373 RepID=UPI0009D4F3A6|nr:MULTISPECIES: amidohydrolase family protein [Pelotomaculum]MCG9968323.1 amidohydrolase family protein [Pelotomaculum terephthalicicum JT]OPX85929.1 MAG: Amidohydrolase [Pelotomaculum sp. PtaB.Bin117]OPY63231.1 MAG: Amidohydrolase [Pelotomaculum sp. PtaU1.Bin065]